MTNYIVPPECRRQLIEVAYAADGDCLMRRTTDRSTGKMTYEIAEWSDLDGEFEPQNREPAVRDDAWEVFGADLLGADFDCS